MKLSENCTETPAEFGQILAGAGEWPGAPISAGAGAGAGAGAPVDHWWGYVFMGSLLWNFHSLIKSNFRG